MDVTFEYILAVIAIFLMLSTSIYVVTNMTSNQLGQVGEQQLTPLVEQLMDKLILTAGSPAGWGYNLSIGNATLQDFGLASSVVSAAYNVDPAKVERLFNSSSTIVNPEYIAPLVVGNLTGLYTGNHWAYGFMLQIVPSLNISVGVPNSNWAVTVHVQTSDSVPAIGASVTGEYFGFFVNTTALPAGSFTYNATSASSIADYAGNATLNFGAPPAPPSGSSSSSAVYVLVVQANYLGLVSSTSSQVSTWSQSPPSCGALVVSQYLLANSSVSNGCSWNGYPYPSGYPSSSVSVIEITDNLNLLVNPSTDLTGVYNAIPNLGTSPLHVFALGNAVSSGVILAGVLVNAGANGFFFVSAPVPPPIAYSSLSSGLNLSNVRLLSAPTVERYVLIGRETYSAYLTVWRIST